MCILLGEINKDSLQISEMEKNCEWLFLAAERLVGTTISAEDFELYINSVSDSGSRLSAMMA